MRFVLVALLLLPVGFLLREQIGPIVRIGWPLGGPQHPRHEHERAQSLDKSFADVGAIPAPRDVVRRRDAIQRVPSVIQESIAFDQPAVVGKLHRARCCAGIIPLFSLSAVETYFEGCRRWPSFCFGDHIGAKARRATLRILAVFPPLRPSHGENRGSSPLGSAKKINDLGALSQTRTGPYGKNTAYIKAARRPSCNSTIAVWALDGHTPRLDTPTRSTRDCVVAENLFLGYLRRS